MIIGWLIVVGLFAITPPNSSKGPHDRWDARDLKDLK